MYYIQLHSMSQHITKAQIKWVRSLQTKKHRDEQGLFIAEGAKCVNDLRHAFELRLLITAENASQAEIEQMSSLRTPQGVIGVFEKRNQKAPLAEYLQNKKILLALDGIQDPGNLGTIIRTCDWFGVYDIICSKDTADCYNPKVVQATMGALARVRVHYVEDLMQTLSELQTAGYPIYGTLLNGENMYAEGAVPNKQYGVIIMGNEGNGISSAVRTQVTHPILIPSCHVGETTSESLNVGIATAIVLAEFRRPLTP